MTFKKELECELAMLKEAYKFMLKTGRFTYEEIKVIEKEIRKDEKIISYLGDEDD